MRKSGQPLNRFTPPSALYTTCTRPPFYCALLITHHTSPAYRLSLITTQSHCFFTLPPGNRQRHAASSNLNNGLVRRSSTLLLKQQQNQKKSAGRNEMVIDGVCTSNIMSPIARQHSSLRQAFVSLLKLITPYLLLAV